MGAHSTMYITRNYAIQKLIAYLLASDDKELAEMLYTYLGDDKLMNFSINGNHEGQDDGCLD